MDSSSDWDFLNFRTDKNIIKILAPGETIILSTPIQKFNRKNKI
jgi:hypothetical protein